MARDQAPLSPWRSSWAPTPRSPPPPDAQSQAWLSPVPSSAGFRTTLVVQLRGRHGPRLGGEGPRSRCQHVRMGTQLWLPTEGWPMCPGGNQLLALAPTPAPTFCAPTRPVPLSAWRSADTRGWGSARPTPLSTCGTPVCATRPTPQTHAGPGAGSCASLHGHRLSPPLGGWQLPPKGPNAGCGKRAKSQGHQEAVPGVDAEAGAKGRPESLRVSAGPTPQGPARAPACLPGGCCARPVAAGGRFSSELLGPQPRWPTGCFPAVQRIPFLGAWPVRSCQERTVQGGKDKSWGHRPPGPDPSGAPSP